MSVEGWKKQILSEVIYFNPSESLKKGAIAKKIAMEQLVPFTRKITDYEMSEFKGGSKFRNGDTLLARITPCLENGKTAYVDILDDGEVAFGSTEFIVMRKKESITDDKFIYYLAISQNFRSKAIQSMIGTSGRQRVQHDTLQSYEISLPPVPEQKAIAATLSALDDTIELNNQINKKLEEMAQAIVKSWFVDFDPFKDEEFEESELGLIPKGWRIGKIGEFADDIKNGGTPSRKKDEYWNFRDYMWLKTGEINNSLIIETEEFISRKGLENSSAKLLPINSVVVAMYGATAGKVGIIRSEMTTNQACCGIICHKQEKALFIYNFLLMHQHYLASLSVGSAQQNLSKETITNIKLVIPPDNIITRAGFTELFEQYESNLRENRALNAIRDTLIPKLMSGEIRVPVEEVEQLV